MIERVSVWLGLAALVLGVGAGCSSCSKKPTEAECRAAIENVRTIRGLDSNTAGVDMNKGIRSCRGSSTKETAKCLTAAKTEAELQNCEGDDGKKYVEQERESERQRKEKVEKNKDDGDADDDGKDEEKKDGE